MNNYSKKFIEKAKKFHNDKYDYSKVNYVNNYTKVHIICPIHGLFEQTPHDHLRYGCRECGLVKASNSTRKSSTEFVNQARGIHKDKYDYSKVDYVNNKTKVTIICPEHGEFEQFPTSHLNGNGCSKCNRGILRLEKLEKFIAKSNNLYENKYDYSRVNYINNRTKVIIICPEHGEFKQTPYNHIAGHQCPKCSKIGCGYQSDTKEIFIAKANKIHDYKYTYIGEYNGSKDKIRIICPIHGEFKQIPNNHLQGAGCHKCSIRISKPHQEIIDFISDNNISVKINDRKTINPYELDILVPSNGLAIEVNGNYWHSYNKIETTAERQKHRIKYEICKESGIKLIQIFEHEWVQKQKIIKSILKSKFNILNNIDARKCKLAKISSKQHKMFMDKNHLQNNKNCRYAYGLMLNGELVSAMSFNRHSKYGWEIARFTNKLGINVVGGANRLLEKFIDTCNPTQIMTYVDIRYSDGNLYKKLGFKLDKVISPNYCYVKGMNCYSRRNFQKYKLKDKLENYNHNITEAENMFNNGYRRLWDAGYFRFIWEASCPH